MFLTDTESVLVLAAGESTRPSRPALRIRWIGGEAHPKISGSKQLPGRSNYYRGHDLTAWQTDVPQYSQVEYEGVYTGVDLRYYGTQDGHLEHDFVVAPGARPEVITLGFSGAKELRLDRDGNLVVSLPGRSHRSAVTLQKPLIYQVDGGQRRAISGGYTVRTSDTIAFRVGDYDRTLPLIIDPVLAVSYSTFLGGSGNDQAVAIAVDGAGYSYVTGYTTSINFPIVNAAQAGRSGSDDHFVFKLSPDGSSLIYATYLGGSVAEGVNAGAIAVDASGNAYVAGTTRSPDFPTTSGAFQTALNNPGQGFNSLDGYVTKLNPSGALVYSTFVGGTRYDGIAAIDVDTSGNAYIAGDTLSYDFPTVNAIKPSPLTTADGFVAKLNASGSALVYSTLLGGNTGPSPNDTPQGIAVDSAGNAYVTGMTGSPDFPTVNAAQATLDPTLCATNTRCGDAFVTKINAAGTAFVYSTFLGGSAQDRGVDVAVDATGAAYIVGDTRSTNFPTLNPLQSANGGSDDAFVAKLSASGALVYSTYLGGSNSEGTGFENTSIVGFGIAVDGDGNAYVAGATSSPNFPAVDALRPFAYTNAANAQLFVSKLNPAGSALVYSTPLNQPREISRLVDIGIDASRSAYVAAAGKDGFPLVNALQPVFGGGTYDAVVVKLSVVDTTPPTVVSTSPVSGALNVDVATSVTAALSESLSPSSVTSTTFELRDGAGVLVSASVSYQDSNHTATLVPASNLHGQTTYTATLKGGTTGSRITDAAGNALANNYSWTFTTIVVNAPPTITAQLSPQPNAAGWNNSNVSVTFTCVDPEGQLAFCSPAVTISDEDAGTQVVGEARDASGLVTTTTVTVNLDKTAPLVAVHTPRPNVPLPIGTTSVTLRGSVADLSGVESLTCGGTSAVITGQQFTCAVPVQLGSNVVSLHAQDRAGLTRDRTYTIVVDDPPVTSIEINPARMTMFAGTTRSLTVTDNNGRTVTDGIWTSSDQSVATVTEDNGQVTVQALASGEATLTVNDQSLSAQAVVTVLAAGSAFPDGTIMWVGSGVRPDRSLLATNTAPAIGEVLPAERNDVPEGVETASLFFIEHGAAARTPRNPFAAGLPTRIHATTLDGRLLWTYTVPERIIHAAADQYGGLLLALDANKDLWDQGYYTRSVRRLDGTNGSTSWEYLVRDNYAELSEMAIRSDGTVFISEEGWTKTELVALDGTTGAVLSRIDLGTSKITTHETTGTSVTRAPAESSAPVVQPDDSVAVVTSWYMSTWNCTPGACTNDQLDKYHKLVTVPADSLAASTQSISVSGSGLESSYAIAPPRAKLVPDGHQGLLLTTEFGQIRRIGVGGTGLSLQPPLQLGTDYNYLQLVVGEDAAWLLAQRRNPEYPFEPQSQSGVDFARVVSFDPQTLAVGYDVPFYLGGPTLQLKTALSGSGVYIYGPEWFEYWINSGEDYVTAWTWDATQLAHGIFAGWQDVYGGRAVELAAGGQGASSAFPQIRGNAMARNALESQYDVVDTAALAILREILPLSELRGIEFGGSICRRSNGKFVATVAHPGVQGLVNPTPCTVNPIRAAEYHTHPHEPGPGGVPGTDGPSGGDLVRSWDEDVLMFIATAEDVDSPPNFCRPQKMGNVWKFKADRSKPKWNGTPPAHFEIEPVVVGCVRPN